MTVQERLTTALAERYRVDRIIGADVSPDGQHFLLIQPQQR